MGACKDWSEPISAWFDGEVEAAERDAVERHLSACAACEEAVRAIASIRSGMRSPAVHRAARHVKVRPRRAAWRLVAAATAAAVAIAVVTGWSATRDSRLERKLIAEAERRHVAAFARAEPCQLESSDPSEVSAWLQHQTGFAADIPRVRNATLLGARVCKIGGEVTAHLLYRHVDGPLSVLAPRGGTSASRAASALARERDGCMSGPSGARVCGVAGSDGGAFAVADLSASALHAILPQ
jgi:anti-sigma factor RsiW